MRTRSTLWALLSCAPLAAQPPSQMNVDPVRPAPRSSTSVRGELPSPVAPDTPKGDGSADPSHPAARSAPEMLQGERSRLEAEKQMLALRVDIETLHRKLAELESGTRTGTAAVAGASLPPTEPAPTIIARRGYDGRYMAVLEMSTGARVRVQPGDRLSHGSVESIDGHGVTVLWYGRREPLAEALVEETHESAGTHLPDLTLPAVPMAVVSSH